MQAGIVEIQRLIRAKYPGATFEIQESPEPQGVYMRAIVDVDEPFLVMDSFIDRLAEIQLDDEPPLHVVVVRTPERMKAAFQRSAMPGSRAVTPTDVPTPVRGGARPGRS